MANEGEGQRVNNEFYEKLDALKETLTQLRVCCAILERKLKDRSEEEPDLGLCLQGVDETIDRVVVELGYFRPDSEP